MSQRPESERIPVFIVGSGQHTSVVRSVSLRVPRVRVRGWTGRAAMSLQTDSAVPTFELAGTRKSRVSEMPLLPRAGTVPSTTARAGSVTTAYPRRSRRASQRRWVE